MNRITHLANETIQEIESTTDIFQLKETIKHKLFEAYKLGMQDANEVWRRDREEQRDYELRYPRL